MSGTLNRSKDLLKI